MESEFRQLSFWQDSVPGSVAPRPALREDITADVAIVGAGYTGLWTAYYLKQIDPALKIVILEAEIAGFGASGRNGGWCSAYLSGIDYWLDDPASRAGAVRLQRLMFDSVREVGEVSLAESIDCHFEQSGALEIAVIPSHLKQLREELDHLRSFGFDDNDYQWLQQSDLAEILNVDRALAAIHMKHCAAIHPSRLARGLAEAVEKMGVSIYEQSPARKVEGREVVAPHGRVKAGSIVLATEGYSGSLNDRGRILIPVHSMMVVTEPLSQRQIGDIRLHKRYCFGNLDRLVTYGQLTADRRIAFGCRGTYHYGSGLKRFDAADPEFDLVRKCLIRFFPGLNNVGFTHAWGGAMGVSRTLRPAVCFDVNSRHGWAGGYFGNGVGAAHLAGKTMADLVTGKDTQRVNTPWVNPGDAERKWEPEPLRWLGIKSRAKLMHLADAAEYRNSVFAPAISKTLDTVFP
jgi:glycine/D-amino acid oxidase-like deaminating enzyme